MSSNYAIFGSYSQNTDYMKAVQNAMSNYGLNFTDASAYINSIWGVSGDVDALVNGDLNSTQKEAIWSDLIQKGFDIVVGLFNQAGKAKEEVNGSDKKINDSKNSSSQTAATAEEELKAIIDDIKNNDVAALNSALEKIDSLGGTQFETIKKEVETKKEEITKEIEALQAELDSDDPNSTKINEHLDNIDTLRKSIPNIVAKVDEIYSALIEQTLFVTDKEKEILTKEANAEKIIADSLNKIKENTATATPEGGYNIQLEVTGGENVAEAETLLAAGATETAAGIFTFGLGAIAGAETEGEAADLMAAGTTRLTGGAKNLTNLGTALGSMGTDYTNIANYTTQLGSAIGNAASIIGQCKVKIPEYIESIGSYQETILAAVSDDGELANNIKEDKQLMTEFTQGQNQDYGVASDRNLAAGKSDTRAYDSYKQNGVLTLKTPNTDITKLFEIQAAVN